MRRRGFLASLGLSGYSLCVYGDQLDPLPSPPTTGEMRKRLDALAPRDAGKSALRGEPHMKAVELETDFLVAGGGVAGVCAALAAARHGANVILVQDRSRLGGNSSSEVKMHVCGAFAQTGWREGGIIEELKLEDAVHNQQRSFELWDLLLYDKVLREPKITLLLDSTLYAASKRGDLIDEVMVRCDKTEHLYRIKAKLFCDATGDSRLGLEAGADMRTGRESRSEFNEPLAQERPDTHAQGSTILFTSRVYPTPMPFVAPEWARKLGKEHFRLRRISELDYGYWWIAWGGNRSTIRDNERIRFELLSIVMGVWDYIKNSGEYPEAANRALDWVGMVPGKRDSRRLVGDYVLTQHDLLRGDIEDAVAIGGWPMDAHPPEGFDGDGLRPAVQTRLSDVYNIPLRSLYSRNVPNLFMAGRNISCSYVAFTSTRVQATCAAEGQAVGTAAAMCVREQVTPRKLYEQKDRLHELQQILLRDDQTIRNRVNEDRLDLARHAKITASTGGETAALVIDGHVRSYPRKEEKQPHQWTAPLGASGAWLELAWDTPQTIRRVQLTFDTGFHRLLMLTASEAVTKRMIRGPQPETVRDYSILYREPGRGALKEVVAVKDNYQRLRRHNFEPIRTRSLRIEVTATNGDAAARIFEVRCYS